MCTIQKERKKERKEGKKESLKKERQRERERDVRLFSLWGHPLSVASVCPVVSIHEVQSKWKLICWCGTLVGYYSFWAYQSGYPTAGLHQILPGSPTSLLKIEVGILSPKQVHVGRDTKGTNSCNVILLNGKKRGHDKEALFWKHFLRKLFDELVKLYSPCTTLVWWADSDYSTSLPHLSHPNDHQGTRSNKRYRCSPPQDVLLFNLLWNSNIRRLCVGPYDCPAKNFRPWPNQLGLSLRQKWSQKASWIAPGQFGCPLGSKLGSKFAEFRSWESDHRIHAHQGSMDETTQRCTDLIPLSFSVQLKVSLDATVSQNEINRLRACRPSKMYLQGCAMSCTKTTYQKSPRLQVLNEFSQFITCGTKHHRVANCKDRYTRPAPEAKRIELQMAKWSGQVSPTAIWKVYRGKSSQTAK